MAAVEIRSPSGALVYQASSAVNLVDFEDTCGDDPDFWMERHDPRLAHLGRFSLYTNPSTQVTEVGNYQVTSGVGLYVYESCADFGEENPAFGAGFALVIIALICCCTSCVLGITACCYGCGCCGPPAEGETLKTDVESIQPTVVGQR
jgi:hypothetical protein